MFRKIKLNLRLFEGEGGGAGAAPAATGTGEAAGNAAEITPGTVLEDGTQVDDRLAARMKRQNARRKARGQAPLYTDAKKAEAPAAEPAQAEAQPAAEPAKGQDEKWTELIKGEFKDQFGKSVQDAIQKRFKNQQDATKDLAAANEKLAMLQPMIESLARQQGVNPEDLPALVQAVQNTDPKIEEEAEAAGMTTESYLTMKRIEAANQKYEEEKQQDRFQKQVQAHYAKLAQQAEALKERFPDFDLEKELFNPNDDRFMRMTSPEGGLDVETAYYAIHHRELEPQAMAYGIQRAQEQMAQTLQANGRRPTEGAMTGGQAGNFQIDPRRMTKAERADLIRRSRLGEKIEF